MWVRYTDGGSTFSAIQEVDTTPDRLSVSPESLVFLVEQGSSSQPVRTLAVQRCGGFTWTVTGDASWLSLQTVGETVEVRVDATGLAPGTYEATITVDAGAGVVGSPARIPVTLVVADQLYDLFLPLVLRGT
ncbi:MAG: hypothetical protein D6759_09805 [Chloroflexi bacterium]|nr:MAG: hypothetical protein D6759_09805 [Chloroflexota bacterium]